MFFCDLPACMMRRGEARPKCLEPQEHDFFVLPDFPYLLTLSRRERQTYQKLDGRDLLLLA